MAEILRGLGLDAQLDEFQPGRANVLARVRGRGKKPALVFSAHLDTVPTGDLPWTFDPFGGDVVGGRLRGRGASDMKSAVAAFVAAADRLNRRGEPLAGDVILAFTAGESANCLGARHLVAQGFQNEIGAFLCGEPSTLDLIVVEKAILWVEAEARGEMGHVSGANGVNAIEIMAAAMTSLRELRLELPDHPLLTPPSLNVGRIAGGTAVNVTPDRCTAEIDIRFGPGIAPEIVLEQISAVLPPRVGLRIIDFKAAVEENPDSPFVACCSAAVAANTGRFPAIKGVSYYSDGAILLDGLDVPFCILGPGDLGMSGQADESADVDAIHTAADIYVTIAEEWLA
ncbi:M20 family metallopeptidase [Mesorhizobium sp.]|uniref:M20 family metallopeptidase n=1 Tax=Mesorhizobium sp. TaxID=1871066 RepID=UPI0025C17782|nr:M20 family metallopeptidase [Mesorhizobium sp.]